MRVIRPATARSADAFASHVRAARAVGAFEALHCCGWRIVVGGFSAELVPACGRPTERGTNNPHRHSALRRAWFARGR